MTQKPPSLRFEVGTIVLPGDRLGTIRQVRPGIGTYVKAGHIYACFVGKLALDESTSSQADADTKSNDDDDKEKLKFVCSVRSSKVHATNQVLKVGQRVVGRISRITPQNALVEIRVAEGVGPIRTPYFEGAIRSEDIQSFSQGKKEENVAVLADCFRPGDLVACRVISMGDARRYFLSTAETELGVIRAKLNDIPMIPISWNEMECPETGVRERRKCAKPLVVDQEQE